MRLRNILMLDVGLIAAACLIPLAPVIAQGAGTGPTPSEARDQIMRVQQDLNDNGFSVPMNGAMGPQTVAALRKYQQEHGLPPTGRIDGQTFTSLEGIAPPTEEEGSVQLVVPGRPPPAVLVVPGAPPPG
jgi:peptidoglycan hydrolase-like protein with peptidoglycan-binding domain